MRRKRSERNEPTGLDLVRMRRALRDDDPAAIGQLAIEYARTMPDVVTFFAEYDDVVRELAEGREMRIRRMAVLKAAGVPRDLWELDGRDDDGGH